MASKADVVNRSRVVTDSGKELKGFDAELYLKDPTYERKLGEWIEETIGEPLADTSNLHESLRDGTVLYKLLNKIQPGIIQSPLNKMEAMSKGAHMRERLYLNNVTRLSAAIPIFAVDDLHAQKYMPAVIENLSKLREVAQAFGTKTNIVPRDPNAPKYESKHWDLQFRTSPLYVEEMADTPESLLQDAQNMIRIQLDNLDRANFDLKNDNKTLRETLILAPTQTAASEKSLASTRPTSSGLSLFKLLAFISIGFSVGYVLSTKFPEKVAAAFNSLRGFLNNKLLEVSSTKAITE